MIGTLKRAMWMVVGLALLCLGVFGRTISGLPIQTWRRVLVVAGGLFFFYSGVMYYLPKHRQRRRELDDLLDQAEREIKEDQKPR